MTISAMEVKDFLYVEMTFYSVKVTVLECHVTLRNFGY